MLSSKSIAAKASLILLLLFASIGAAQPTIVNPDFQADGGFFRVAIGWQSFGANKWEGVWDPDRSFTQGIADIGPGRSAGVYQKIPTVLGTSYRLEVSAKSSRADYRLSVGVDSRGGTDAGRATYSSRSSSASWNVVSLEFVAAANEATIFLRGDNSGNRYLFGSWAQFDAVRIASSGPANLPPSASASANPTRGAAPLAVQFRSDGSSDPEGGVLRFQWSFGDGSSNSANASPAHTYASDGRFTARLTVTDPEGLSATAAVEIQVGTPSTNLIENGDFSQGLGFWTRWSDRGQPGSRIDSGRLSLSGRGINGGLLQRFATGGAGTEIEIDGFWASNPTVARAQWAEVLIVNSDRVVGANQDINGNQPGVLLIYKNDTFRTPNGWSGKMSDTAPVHRQKTFVAQSSFATLVLKTGNTGQTLSGVSIDDVLVSRKSGAPGPGNSAPTAAATAEPSAGIVPLVVRFDGSGSTDPDGDALRYTWDFGDGEQGQGSVASHTYSGEGRFEAKLTVSDTAGATDEKVLTITVNGAGGPGGPVDWDDRLSLLGLFLEQANVSPGTGYWKLVRARFESDGEILPPPGGGSESNGTHSIYFRALDESGFPIEGQRAIQAWPTGNPTNAAELRTKGPGIDDYWGDAALFGGWCPFYPNGPRGSYGAYIADAPSDRVWGMGLPCNRHVSYRLTWQWTVKR